MTPVKTSKVICELRRNDPRDRFYQCLRETYLGLDLEKAVKVDEFKAEFQTRSVGTVTVTLARSTGGVGALSWCRNRRIIADESEAYMVLMLIMSGVIHHTQYGRTVEALPGTMVLIDSREPYLVDHSSHSASLNVRVPLDLIREVLPDAERYCGRGIDARVGMNALQGDSLFSVWRHAGDLSLTEAPLVCHRIVETISTLCASIKDAKVKVPRASVQHYERAEQYIHAHLGDPCLGPDRIAAALKISTGHLHAIMREKDTSVGKLILNMRLDRCRANLADIRLSGRTITCIALDWGFNDLAHFSRVFKKKFSMTPRQCRSLALCN